MQDHPFDPDTDGFCKAPIDNGGGPYPCGEGAEHHTHTQPPPKRPRARKTAPPKAPHGLPTESVAHRMSAMFPGTYLVECMVGNCEWALVMYPLSQVVDDSLALAQAYGVEEAAAAVGRERAEWIDHELRAHLVTHDVVEWAQTIRDIEDANQAWEAQYSILKGERDRLEEMNVVLSQRLQETEVKLSLAGSSHHPRAARDLPRDAMPLPMGIPAPVLDPMKERIVPSDKRAEGQVARKG